VKLTIWYILILLLLLPQVANTQEYTIDSFSKEGGLPSDYCYNAVQDDAGFMWISTESALCTFDGLQFQTGIFPELANKEIYNVYKDSKGRVWFNELSGELYYLENGKISRLRDIDEINNDNITNICDDHLGHIWITQLHGSHAICLDANSLEILHIARGRAEQLETLKEFNLFRDSSLVSIQNDSLFYVQNGIRYEFGPFDLYRFFVDQINYNKHLNIFIHRNKFYYFDLRNGDFHRILEEHQHLFDKGVQCIAKDKYKNLWMSTATGFHRISDPVSDSSKLTSYFKNVNGASVTIDNQENIWLVTLDEGIKKLSETYIKIFKDKNARNVTSILKHENYLIYGTDKGEVVVLDKNEKEVYREILEDQKNLIYTINIHSDSCVLVCSSNGINLLDLNKLKSKNIWENGFYKSATSLNDRIWINGGLKNYTGFIGDAKAQEVLPTIRSYSNLPISEEEAYIGTIKGLYRSHKNGLHHSKILPSIIKSDVKSIAAGPDSTIWVGTHGNGIYILANDTLKHHLTELASMYIHDIKRYQNKMWVATTGGVSQITNVNNYYISKTLNRSDGLSSDEINRISISEGKLYAATTKGISVFDTNIKFNNETPIIKIDNIRINERDTLIQQKYELSEDQRNVKISFGGILYNQPGSIIYKYRLAGVDSDWITTDQNTAQYPTLGAGDYKFMVNAKSMNSRWSEMKTIEFIIPERFTEHTISKILMVLAGFSISFLCFTLFYKSQERSRQFELSQMTALRAQLNPHFIFNSLNSVQDYILRDDKRSANKYISNFSKLMRYILNASDKEYTSLEKEIEALELYVSIESMRFDNTLEYHFEIDPKIDPKKCEIPTMILQPYLENAINHGLKPVKGRKLLVVKVFSHETGLKVEIEDNGVGRKKSRKIKMRNEENYASKGTLINQKRIDLLNKINQNKNKVTFKDIYDLKGNPSGTKVEILLRTIKLS